MTFKACALLLAAALLFSAPSMATEENDRGESDGDERGLKVQVGSEGFDFKLEEERADLETETKVSFKADAARLKAQVERENSTGESEYELEVRLGELIEYRDQGGDGLYVEGSDAVAQRIAIRGLPWTMAGPTPATMGGVAVTQVSARAPLGANGSLSLIFAASEDSFRAGASQVDPDAVKFDILIEDFPWRENGTRLALTARVIEEQESEVKEDEDDRGEDRVEARVKGLTGSFRWATNATVDGSDVAVKSSIDELRQENHDDEDDEVEKASAVTLNYPQGRSILHDPVLGIAMADKGVPLPGVVLIAPVAALAALARRTREA